jgi:hypothetical protein
MLMIRGLVKYPDYLREEREKRIREMIAREEKDEKEPVRRKSRARPVEPTGKCVYCRVNPKREGRQSCEPCAKKEAERKRGSWDKARELAAATNKCRDCKKRDRRETAQTCEVCGARRKRYAQTYRDK